MPRSVRFRSIGGPEVLTLDEIDVPTEGPGEVRIRIRAWGLNRADVMFRTGHHFAVPVFPQAQGLEAAGLGMSYATAYGALIDIADLHLGDVMAIPAESSSVGLAAVQIANLIGGRPIALSRTAGKHDQLLAAGAAAVIATETEDVTGRLLDLTDGAGVNVVFDPVAGPGPAALLAGTAQYATVIIYGALSAGPTELPLLSLLQKRLTIRGYDMVEVVADDTRLARAVAFINAGIESGALTPVIDTVFPVSEITDAYAYLEAKSQFGNVVVTAPDPPIPTRPQPAPRRPRPSAVHAWPACADYQTRTGRQIPILLARLAPSILTSHERMGLSCRGRSPLPTANSRRDET